MSFFRCFENYHRILSVEAHARHILFREESRYPGYYYRGDFNKIDDENWKCFTNSKYNSRESYMGIQEGSLCADVSFS